MMWTAFILGLGGSLHCIGMCGPIAAIVPGGEGTTIAEKFLKSLVYNVGRVLGYSCLGLMFGIFGKGLFIGGFQQSMSVVFGALIIISVIFPLALKKVSPNSTFFSIVNRLKSLLIPMINKKSLGGSLVVGMLNALLPCGLVYVALAGATLTGDPLLAAEYMAVFGAGTMTLMLAVGLGSTYMMNNYKRQLQKLVPIIIFTVGLLFILRGLNLGIPYLSPKIEKGEKVSCH